MKSLKARVLALEERTRSSESFAKVLFADGSAQGLPLQDAIPFLKTPDEIVTITCEDSPGQGLLLDLIKDLL